MDKEPGISGYPAFGVRNFERLYGNPQDAALRAEYVRRGIIPTNNLFLYIVDEPKPELAPGIRNTFDYRQRPFGTVISQLRDNSPNLWEQAKKVAAESTRRTTEFSDLLFEGRADEAMLLRAGVDEAYWAKAEVFDTVFRIIAPQLEALGIDPVEVCK